jgi:hypothetical protein
MLHLWITRHPLPETSAKKRNWFGLLLQQSATSSPAGSAPPQGPEMQWRHLNCMDYACMIHTTDVMEARHHDLPWLGHPGLPFTNRMTKHIVACVTKGVELAAVSEWLNVAYADLWKLKFSIDQSRVQTSLNGGSSHIATGAGAGHAIPEPTHPIWEHWVCGELAMDIKTLGLQLLLSKLRQQIHLQPTPEVKSVKLRELHRYMTRNAPSLGHELQQIQHHLRQETA